ncbi:MAG: hypothetical protein ACRYF3_10935, partial [Janthinobacterium lividum]
MDTLQIIVGLIVVIALAGVGAVVGLVRPRRRRGSLPPRPGEQSGLGSPSGDLRLPGVGDDAEVPRDSAT